MYATDRGIDQLDDERGDEMASIAWLADRMRAFVDLHPDDEAATNRLAAFLAADEADTTD